MVLFRGFGWIGDDMLGVVRSSIWLILEDDFLFLVLGIGDGEVGGDGVISPGIGGRESGWGVSPWSWSMRSPGLVDFWFIIVDGMELFFPTVEVVGFSICWASGVG